MGFFDLNVPYHESDRHAIDKSSLRGRRLKLALKAMELGYTGVAYNRTLKGVMSESDRCSTQFFPLSKVTPLSSSFFAAVKFHRELLNVAVSSPFRQYTRLTVIVDISSQASALNAGNPILRSYDIVAIRPMNQNAFDQACQTAEVDMIAIDFSDKLPFRLKQPMIKAAIQRGLYFEITYSGLIADAQTRRQMISNCKLLVDWTRGKNLIISSGAPSVTELRGPQDVANLFSLLGLPSERAKAAISKNCRCLLANASMKRHFYKEAVKVEPIPSGELQSAFDDWLKWDPISSGEGDLLLDELEKSFAISNTLIETVKTINFTSSMNGLPAHDFQIKDLISVTKAALEPPVTNNFDPVAMEAAKVDTVENCEESGGLNALHEGKSSLLENQDSVINLSKQQASSSDVISVNLPSSCQDSEVSLDYIPKRLVAFQSIPQEGQPSLNGEQVEHQAFYVEHSALSSFPTHKVTYCNHEETIRISSCNLDSSNDLESNPVASEIQSPPRMFVGNGLHDGGEDIMKIETPITHSHVSAAESSSSVFTLEESNEENRCGVGSCAQEGVPGDMIPDKTDSDDKQGLPMVVSSDAPVGDVYVEGEPNCEMINSPVKLCDGLPIEGLLNFKTDLKEPISGYVKGENKQIDLVTNYRDPGKSGAGRERRKRKSPHQPFLLPFKHFLNARKSWK